LALLQAGKAVPEMQDVSLAIPAQQVQLTHAKHL
jgi:hypothetical protein